MKVVWNLKTVKQKKKKRERTKLIYDIMKCCFIEYGRTLNGLVLVNKKLNEWSIPMDRILPRR
jgi:predicted transcriptional regulator